MNRQTLAELEFLNRLKTVPRYILYQKKIFHNMKK